MSAAPPAYVLAACDPANPYGAALPWPWPVSELVRSSEQGQTVRLTIRAA